MSAPNPEFSRLVAVARLGSEPSRHEIEATAHECRHLAQRFDLLTLDRLAAAVTLQRQNGGFIRLEAAFEAEFTQSCVVTLEPVPGKIVDGFVLLYGSAENAPIDIDPDIDEPAFEPLTGDTIDIGEAVAQELSLTLPEFPRHPDADIEPTATPEPQRNPFALLTNLQGPRRH
jgi:uncharacterized metal-binding protein YceD (DUF177 family)